jgi:hypothetical protein
MWLKADGIGCGKGHGVLMGSGLLSIPADNAGEGLQGVDGKVVGIEWPSGA